MNTKTVEQQAAEVKAALLAPVNELKYRMDEMEQKQARPRGGGYSLKSPGQQVVESAELKAMAALSGSQAGHVRIDVTNITSLPNSGGGAITPMRDTNVNELARRLPRIKDLLNVVNTNSGSVEYLEQTTANNNAAPQTEGELKGEFEYAWELKTLPIRTIAHWTPASVQILADAPQMQSMIDGELRHGLAIAEDVQLLSGSGIAPNLNGMIPEAATYTPDFTPGSETMIDKIGLGILQVALAEYMANGIAVHPSDWMRMRLLKDGDGKYILGDPGADVAPVLFGLPVVPTTGMEKDKFLVGDFASAATLYDRQSATLAVSTEHADFFTRNLVALRMESRMGLAIRQPTALSFGDFGNTP